MKLPERISFATPELALVAAEYLERNHGRHRDPNITLTAQGASDYFWGQGPSMQLKIYDTRVAWHGAGRATAHVKSFAEFLALFDKKQWKIGCRTVTVGTDGKSLRIEVDNVTIPKSTLEEMLKALS